MCCRCHPKKKKERKKEGKKERKRNGKMCGLSFFFFSFLAYDGGGGNNVIKLLVIIHETFFFFFFPLLLHMGIPGLGNQTCLIVATHAAAVTMPDPQPAEPHENSSTRHSYIPHLRQSLRHFWKVWCLFFVFRLSFSDPGCILRSLPRTWHRSSA